MNNARRKKLEKLAEKLELLREQLDLLMEEEQEYFDNMPESLQGGEKGEQAEAAIQQMEEAGTCIDDAISQIQTAAE